VTIAVQTDVGDIAGALIGSSDGGEQILGQRAVGEFDVRGNAAGFQQVLIGLCAEIIDVQRGSVRERLYAADRVNAPEKTPKPFQVVGVVQIRPAPPTARIERETETGMHEQRSAVLVCQRGYHGNLRLQQFVREGVFLQNRRILPAPRPVELRHQIAPILQPDLIDAILVTVECQQMAIGHKAFALDRIEDEIGPRSA